MADTERIGVVFTEQGWSDLMRKANEFKDVLNSLQNARIGKLEGLESVINQLAEATQRANELKQRIQDAVASGNNKNSNLQFQADKAAYKEQRAIVRDLTNQRKVLNLELDANAKAIEKTRIEQSRADKEQKEYGKNLEAQTKAQQKAIEDRQKAQAKAAKEEAKASREKEREEQRAARAEQQRIAQETKAKEAAYRYEQQLRENAQKSAEKEDAYRRQQEQEEAREQARLQQEAVQRYQSTMRGISTVLGGAGALSSLTGSFASGIGSAFSGMSGLFGNTNVSTALTRFMTYNALRGLTNNISGIVSRYDIMSTFLPYMEVAGVGNDAAQVALDRVNQAILGLPIGLDESAQRLRRYQMFLGNVDDATNLTIGAQNAILAGGASEQMKNMAYMQIDRLLAAGRLNTARQWLSLIQGMGVSMRFISEQMGVAGMDVRDLAAGLASGAIDAKEFLNALMELGKGESDAAQGLEATLDIYKGTIEAWINNISFAATRGGENIMKALNQTLVDSTGQGITGYMKNYRDFLNSVFGKADSGGGISGWIMDNPDAIIGVMREGYTVIDALTRFNASDIGTGLASNTERLFSAISTGLNTIPDGKLEEFVSFATTLAGPVGAGMSQASNLGVMLGVFERFKGFDFDMLTSDMSNAVGDMSNIVNWLLNVGHLKNDNFMSNLLAYGAVFGKPVGSALTTLARGASSLAMLKIAFPSLFKFGARASGGGMEFLASAFDGGLPASVEGELAANALWGEAVPSAGTAIGLLVPTLLAGGIFAGLSAADKRNYAQMVNQYGLSNIGSANVDISNALLGARANFSQITTIPALNKANADQQRANIQANLDYLQSLYTEQESYRAVLQDESKQLHAEIDRINRGEGVTAEDIVNLPNLEQRAKEVDSNLTTVKGNISELNGEIIKEGLVLDDIVIKFGDYETEVDSTTQKTKEAADAASELANKQREVADAYTQTRNAAFKSVQAQLGGLDLVERGKPDKGYSSFVSQDLDYIRKQNEMGESLLTNADYINQFLQETEDYEFGLGITDYLDRVLGTEDIEQILPRFEEVADLIESGNFERLRELIAELNTSNEFSGEGGLLSTLNKDMGETVTTLQEKETEVAESFGRITDALNGSTVAAEESFTSFKDNLIETTGVTEDELGNMTGVMEKGMGDVTSAARTGVNNTSNEIARLPGEISGQAGAAESAAASVSAGVANGLSSNLDLIAGIVDRINSLVGQVATGVINAASATGSAPVQNQSGPIAVTRATGGPIFKAFGSDTVPAMLTPGEYIIRKGAADFFGRGLLERINALDIGGAFDRLILNSPVTAGRFGGNVYNKDNHASVNQTFINSSPDYGNRRAWRFAHSL